MTVSDFQILIKSCSIESRNDPSPKSEVVHETKFNLKISNSTHTYWQEWTELISPTVMQESTELISATVCITLVDHKLVGGNPKKTPVEVSMKNLFNVTRKLRDTDGGVSR